MKNKNSLLLVPVILAMPLLGSSGCSVPQNDGGSYKTTDGGQNWEQKITIEENKNNLAKADVSQLLVDPNDPNAVFMVTVTQGLYVSNNFGDSWKRIIPETNTIYAIEADARNKGTFYASILLGDRAKIVKTKNGGQDWDEVYTEPGKQDEVTNIKMDPFAENSLLAANSTGLIMRSSNGGNSWQATYPFENKIKDIFFDPEIQDTIWVLTDQGIWYSRDGGFGFDQLELDPNGEMGNNFYLLRKERGVLFLATDKGFFESPDNGVMWKRVITLSNPTKFPMQDFVIFPGQGNKWIMAAGMALYITEDGGQNWKPIQLDISRTIKSIVIKNDDLTQMLVGVKTAGGGGLGL